MITESALLEWEAEAKTFIGGEPDSILSELLDIDKKRILALIEEVRGLRLVIFEYGQKIEKECLSVESQLQKQNASLDWLEEQLRLKDELIANQSDGYHTMKELYEHRCLLYINLCLQNKQRAFWKPDYEGWFWLYLETDSGQISYHCPNSMLPLIKNIQRDDNHQFDGHKSEDVIFRLRNEALMEKSG